MVFDFLALANLIRTFAVTFAVITIGYAGFTLLVTKDAKNRNEWKEIIAGVFVGLILLFLAPLIAGQLTGGNYCR